MHDAPIAQLVEQLLRKQWVGGSSPSWGTIHLRPCQIAPAFRAVLIDGTAVCGDACSTRAEGNCKDRRKPDAVAPVADRGNRVAEVAGHRQPVRLHVATAGRPGHAHLDSRLIVANRAMCRTPPVQPGGCHAWRCEPLSHQRPIHGLQPVLPESVTGGRNSIASGKHGGHRCRQRQRRVDRPSGRAGAAFHANFWLDMATSHGCAINSAGRKARG